MKVLIVGNGGREHALAWKAAQSAYTTQVFVAPGNAGTAREQKVENINIEANDISGLVHFARQNKVELTIVGPETPLVEGIVDEFHRVNLTCFGPTKYAAQLEGSKVFTKEFLSKHNIPTAGYNTFTELTAATAYLKLAFLRGQKIVIKADGLAAGKGVFIIDNEEEAINTVKGMLEENQYGEAGKRVVIEEFLTGEEVSFICMVDGEHVLPLATAQDHKRLEDGDQGPNTGGMGAYSPAPLVTPEIQKRIMMHIIEPTVLGMAAEKHPYVGFLYAGLMIDEEGMPKVLEFNCRLGDPEAQCILMRLKSDLIELCQSTLKKRLNDTQAEWDNRAALSVVMASQGYPGEYLKDIMIHGLPEAELMEGKVFHAGTTEKGGQILTAGGRVLAPTAFGGSIAEAQKRAYEIVEKITWNDVHYRKDIGYRGIEKENNPNTNSKPTPFDPIKTLEK